MSDGYDDPIRETIFRVLIDSGMLRPVPVPLQIVEVVNGRSYRIVPLEIFWPSSCLYYASQDERLERELLLHVYERKTVLDGGIHMKKPAQPPLELPEAKDNGWLRPRESARPPTTAWSREFRVTAQVTHPG